MMLDLTGLVGARDSRLGRSTLVGCSVLLLFVVV
jgi:hypothetical protein